MGLGLLTSDRTHIDQVHSQRKQCQRCPRKWTRQEQKAIKDGDLSVISNHQRECNSRALSEYHPDILTEEQELAYVRHGRWPGPRTGEDYDELCKALHTTLFPDNEPPKLIRKSQRL